MGGIGIIRSRLAGTSVARLGIMISSKLVCVSVSSLDTILDRDEVGAAQLEEHGAVAVGKRGRHGAEGRDGLRVVEAQQ